MLKKIFPFWEIIKKYDKQSLQKDLIAALTVAIIALPQSMAYALIAGIHPKYGLYAAIIPVIVASLYGSSRFLIAGPTNALAMMTASITSSVFIGGVLIDDMPVEQKISVILTLTLLAGLTQIIFGLAKFGSLINFVSHSVVVSFTAGAGLLIAANQLKNFLGLNTAAGHDIFHTLFEISRNILHTNPKALALGLFTVIAIILARKISARAPGALIGVLLSALLVWLLDMEQSVKLIGEIPRSLPPINALPMDFDLWRALLSPALAIAILGIVEAMSIAKSLANRSGDRINGNQEIIAQGLANAAAAFTNGMPGTGSFTRSAVNFQSGAATNFAGVFSGLIVMAIILAIAPLSRFIPLSSLAGVLIMIAYGMVDKRSIRQAWKATSSDRIVIAITFASTLLLELEKAVYIGVILSIILFLRKVSHPQVNRMVPRPQDRRMAVYEKGMPACPQITIFQIDGALFFGAVNEIEETFSDILNESGSIIIIRLKGVRLMDATGAHTLERFVKTCRSNNIKLIITNLKPTVAIVMKRIGLDQMIGEKNIVENTTAAIKLAIGEYADKEKCAKCRRAIFAECPSGITRSK